MKEINPQPEATTIAHSIGEQVDNLNAAPYQQASFQASAINAGSGDQLHQPPRALPTQLSIGPPLAAGYAPISLVRAPSHQRTPVPRTRVGPSSHSRKKASKLTPNASPEIVRELAEVRAAWERYRTTNDRDAVYLYL